MRHVTLAGTVLLALAAGLAGAGCKDAGDDQDSTLRAAIDSMPLVTRDTAARVAWNDANALAMLEVVNIADSAAGALAAQRARNDDVRTFAQRMMREHGAIRTRVKETVGAVGITPEMPSNDTSVAAHNRQMERLRTIDRASFDSAYVNHEVAAHEHAIAVARTAEQNASNDQVKRLAREAIPTLQAHLDRAKELQTKYGGR